MYEKIPFYPRYFQHNTFKTAEIIPNYEKPRQSTHWKRNHPDWCSDAFNHNCTESKASTLNLVSAPEEPGNASTTGNGHSSSKRQEQQSGYTGGTAECKHPRKTGIAGQHRKKKRQPQKWQCCARTPASSTSCHLCKWPSYAPPRRSIVLSTTPRPQRRS